MKRLEDIPEEDRGATFPRTEQALRVSYRINMMPQDQGIYQGNQEIYQGRDNQGTQDRCEHDKDGCYCFRRGYSSGLSEFTRNLFRAAKGQLSHGPGHMGCVACMTFSGILGTVFIPQNWKLWSKMFPGMRPDTTPDPNN